MNEKRGFPICGTQGPQMHPNPVLGIGYFYIMKGRTLCTFYHRHSEQNIFFQHRNKVAVAPSLTNKRCTRIITPYLLFSYCRKIGKGRTNSRRKGIDRQALLFSGNRFLFILIPVVAIKSCNPNHDQPQKFGVRAIFTNACEHSFPAYFLENIARGIVEA